ncbi:MAG: hypothetical protein FWD71_08065 [Oscillospiraceae bacterium]|nr:hypothetical protein [Oscillospiraceae bacterium]
MKTFLKRTPLSSIVLFFLLVGIVVTSQSFGITNAWFTGELGNLLNDKDPNTNQIIFKDVTQHIEVSAQLGIQTSNGNSVSNTITFTNTSTVDIIFRIKVSVTRDTGNNGNMPQSLDLEGTGFSQNGNNTSNNVGDSFLPSGNDFYYIYAGTNPSNKIGIYGKWLTTDSSSKGFTYTLVHNPTITFTIEVLPAPANASDLPTAWQLP